jgi:hypothetical protein
MRIWVPTWMRALSAYSPTMEGIVAWRERLAEELTWDEGITFEVSEDVATSGDAMFHYVAAALDQRGKSELSRLLDVGRPPQQELNAAFAEASRASCPERSTAVRAQPLPGVGTIEGT